MDSYLLLKKHKLYSTLCTPSNISNLQKHKLYSILCTPSHISSFQQLLKD